MRKNTNHICEVVMSRSSVYYAIRFVSKESNVDLTQGPDLTQNIREYSMHYNPFFIQYFVDVHP